MLEARPEPRPALTQRQREIYEFLKDKILNRGYGPTVREIGNHFGIRSPNGVMCHLKALERKGLITREQHMSRAIQLAEAPEYRVTLRDAGVLNGSGPIKPSGNGERVDFASLFDTEGNCCLRIAGDTLAQGGIHDGDCLVVNRYATAEHGDIVVANLAANSAAVRRVRKIGGDIHLEDVSGSGEAGEAGDAEIVGVVSGVIRRYR